MQVERIGELKARILGGTDGRGGGDGPVVVLLHGFGAGGDDLVGLARVLDAPTGTRFVFPEAPLALDSFGARAWWMIDPEIFEQRARGEQVDRTDEQPDRLPQARAELSSLLDALPKRLRVRDDQLVLGGFSQGSMLALDVALHRERKPRGLALLSSTLIAESLWKPRMASLAGTPIFQSHGSEDPLLPFEAAESLRGLLLNAGAKVTFVPFRGGHDIPPAVLAALNQWLSDLLTEG